MDLVTEIKGWQTLFPEGSGAKIRRIDRCPNIPCKLSPTLHDTANTWRRRDVNNGDANSPCTIKLHFHWQNRVDASHVTASTLTIHLIVIHPSILISESNSLLALAHYLNSWMKSDEPVTDILLYFEKLYLLRNSVKWRLFKILLENRDIYICVEPRWKYFHEDAIKISNKFFMYRVEIYGI